jgi:glycosyltransferase involved in cell wall biosynthesis
MKILFFTHDLHRAGAQIYVLRFLKWLHFNQQGVKLKVVSFGKGKLREEFEKYAPVSEFNKKKSILPEKFKKNKLQRLIDTFQPDIIYNNTWMNGERLLDITVSCPVVTHVHELNYWIDKGGEKNSIGNIEKSNKYFTDSISVAVNLNKRYNILLSDCNPVYLAIDSEKGNDYPKNKLKDHLKLRKESVIIGACGVESYRKGKDFFIDLIDLVVPHLKAKEVHFVWIGGKLDPEIEKRYNKSVYKNNIHFISTIPNAHEYFSDFDIFWMVSRDDPFPTVNLEVGSQGVPIVCFKDSGGTHELIKDDGGVVIESMDLNKFADASVELCLNDALRKKMGDTLKKRVLTNFNLNTIGSNVFHQLEKIIHEYKKN